MPQRTGGVRIPAVLTHDFFGRDVLDAQSDMGIATIDERDAFLLGNQGPDPLFFLSLSPRKLKWHRLGSTMHKEQPAELLHALARSVDILQYHEQGIGRAYAQGFLCHYLLDSMEHPLIYATEHTLCDAGIEGLSRKDGREVHAEIERELDEMVLFAKRKETIRAYSPAENTLDANEIVLEIIQKMYAYMALTVYGEMLDAHVFPLAVGNYRAVLFALYSPLGIKRALVGTIERNIRPRAHSFYAAMAHTGKEVHDSWFANSAHQPWIHPFTGAERTDSFWDIYKEALSSAQQALEQFNTATFSLEAARALTQELNFKGEPTKPVLVVHA